MNFSLFFFLFSGFFSPQQDNIDRSSNHRQTDLIGPAFQPSANQSSPNHQGWSWATNICVWVCVCASVSMYSAVSSLPLIILCWSWGGGGVGGNNVLSLGLFRCKHFDSSKGDQHRHRVPLFSRRPSNCAIQDSCMTIGAWDLSTILAQHGRWEWGVCEDSMSELDRLAPAWEINGAEIILSSFGIGPMSEGVEKADQLVSLNGLDRQCVHNA